ncbi:hypothetical protein AAFC00_006066 [Neodothiora populina]|uniref:DAGKc domain-containing protein n=1 Tax=Neodothiora populina TaxID=2781224 RepID=A0ABR3P6U9_9PEZI
MASVAKYNSQYGWRQVHVVISVASGTRQAEDFYKSKIAPLLGNIKVEYQSHTTTSADSIIELTTDVFIPNAERGIPQTILLLSGDGGMVDIVNTFMNTPTFSDRDRQQYCKPIIAIFPLGTGNALASSLKVEADDAASITALLDGTPRSLPIFRAKVSPGARLLTNEARDEVVLPQNAAWGCVVCSWGLHASLVADSDTAECRKHGAQRFAMAAKENLFPADGQVAHSYAGRVSVLRKNEGDWEELERKHHAYVLATLVSNLEKTFTISPESKPLDGKLRLVHFGPMDGDAVMEIMKAAYDNGKHVQDPDVSYEAIQGVRIDFDEEDARWRRICVDGKIIGVETGGYVEVTKEAEDVLDVLVCEMIGHQY